MCAWYMEQTLERLQMVQPSSSEDDEEVGQHPPEQALGIFDLRGFSPLQADLEFAYFLVEVIHNYYPGRFARILLFDAPEAFKVFWDSIRPLLHRYAELAHFVSAREVGRDYFAPGE